MHNVTLIGQNKIFSEFGVVIEKNEELEYYHTSIGKEVLTNKRLTDLSVQIINKLMSRQILKQLENV